MFRIWPDASGTNAPLLECGQTVTNGAFGEGDAPALAVAGDGAVCLMCAGVTWRARLRICRARRR